MSTAFAVVAAMLHFCSLNSSFFRSSFLPLLPPPANGTYVNGSYVGRGNDRRVRTGDVVGVLMRKPDLTEVEMGFVLTMPPSQ